MPILESEFIKSKVMNYTQSIGNVVELKCIAKFIELGYEVSIPYGNGARYDFIVDVNGQFLKIQCKSCSHPKSKTTNDYDTNALQISTSSLTTNTQKTVRHSYTKEQIDYFATSYNDQIYLIPVEECSSSKILRLSPPRSTNNIYNKAEDYEIEKIISPSNELLKSKEEFIQRCKQNDNEESCFCSTCNNKINLNSKTGLCIDCYNKSRRKERPNREELKKMIRAESFSFLGRKYGVSDNAIKKWCLEENLPSLKSEIKKYTDEDWEKI